MSDATERGYDRVQLPLGQVIMNNLLGGIAWGFGTVVGATIVVGIIAWALSQLGFLPLVGEALATLQDTIESFRRLR